MGSTDADADAGSITNHPKFSASARIVAINAIIT